ncbi:hypothetical protein JM946_11805 [Steroidobacter sp. S1-65]|uniref:Response regulatory domain-containing protein n=1 Tax=Steroidobacter gossypii TaxID=2805490 RepID=A0ABS1WWT9_9GAMM|nr:hypothetical protein [Steroidobacter gossypii]MBM0105439.1 hypothetical protein [Steroidobacter gossypii]
MSYNVLVAEPRDSHWASIANGVRRRQPEAEILRVKDGEQAVRFLFQRGLLTEEPDTPDLIVLAADLPLVPVNAILARLRQHPRTRTVPVIFMWPDCGDDDSDDGPPESQQWLHPQPDVLVILGTHRLDKEVADAIHQLSAKRSLG